MDEYNVDFLQRLNAYRENMNMSKEQMAKMFCVHPSHYGRLETGNKIISYKSLKAFGNNGGDIFFLFTGHSREAGPIDNFVSKCRTKQSRMKLLSVLNSCIDLGIWLDKISLNGIYPSMYKSLRLLELENDKYTIWESLRKVECLTQQRMAKVLDIDVKRYRRIEKEQVEPDAEIMYTLYCQLHYSPQLFLNREKFYLDELNYYWNLLSEETQVYIESVVNNTIGIIKENEENESRR